MMESLPVPSSRARKLRLAMVVAALGIVAAGAAAVLFTSGSTTAPGAAISRTAQVNAYATAQAATSGPVLYKLDTGEPVPFENGETLRVGDLDVTIYVSPYPPPRAANIDFGVERAGVALDDAYVTLQYDMTTMAHGPFKLLAIPAGGGHYVVPVEFEMEGDFYLNVAVDDGSTESVLQLGVRARR
jgi:hypothetical protein